MNIRPILIADDQPEILRVLDYALTGLGLGTIACHDGREAVALAARERPPILILDALMPRLHGFEVSKRIKSIDEGYRPRVIILTSVYRGVRYRNEAWKDFGVDAYLEKPVVVSSVVRAVHRNLEWLCCHDPAQLADSPGPPLGSSVGKATVAVWKRESPC